jgi:hypothetical protein
MAENRVIVESGNVTIAGGTVNTVPVAPAGINFYTSSFSAIAGQTATPYNFLSLFNPLASGKTIVIYAAFIIPWASGATSTTNPMESFRTTAASAGTLTSGASIGKFATSQPNSVAELRTGNPTVTVSGLTLGGIPPLITAAGSGASSLGNITAPTGASFVLVPGEGLCMRQVVAGDVDQLWNLGFIWAEA